MVIGADGDGMHSLNGSRAGKVTVRLLKTSPQNKKLMDMYNFQRTSSILWGRNIITITDRARGDLYVGREAAFIKPATNSFAKEAAMMEWEFNAVKIDGVL